MPWPSYLPRWLDKNFERFYLEIQTTSEKSHPQTFNAVLKIQEDTTYECISRVGYNPEFEELCAKVDIKKLFGYSSDALIDGSEEFVRFYLSYDEGIEMARPGNALRECDRCAHAATAFV